jgi:hypothetical protein
VRENNLAPQRDTQKRNCDWRIRRRGFLQGVNQQGKVSFLRPDFGWSAASADGLPQAGLEFTTLLQLRNWPCFRYFRVSPFSFYFWTGCKAASPRRRLRKPKAPKTPHAWASPTRDLITTFVLGFPRDSPAVSWPCFESRCLREMIANGIIGLRLVSPDHLIELPSCRVCLRTRRL